MKVFRTGVHPQDRVFVSVIREYGEVTKIRQDARGIPVIDILLDSGKKQICREYEVCSIEN